jgi:tRNA-2-methylthio-N6-dimethylallyladenosine synthase
MRRSYRQERTSASSTGPRRHADAAITTDIIVGLPRRDRGRLRADPRRGRAARFAGAFTFQYSPRAGTPAAALDGQLPKAVVQERYERLVELQDEMSWSESKKQVGRVLDVLVAEGEGRKDGATHRMSGRGPDNRLVHFAPPEASGGDPGLAMSPRSR